MNDSKVIQIVAASMIKDAEALRSKAAKLTADADQKEATASKVVALANAIESPDYIKSKDDNLTIALARISCRYIGI